MKAEVYIQYKEEVEKRNDDTYMVAGTRVRLFWCVTLVSGLLQFGASVHAQQLPLLSHYFYNPYLFNPASTGQTKETRAFLFYRQQWVGMPDAPETQTFTIDGALSQTSRVGLGLFVSRDQNNILGRVTAMASASYTLPLGEMQELAFGMSLGVFRNQIAFDKIRGDVSDPSLLLNNENKSSFDGNAGIIYRYRKLRAGFASEQLLERQLTYSNRADSRDIGFQLVRHYLVSLQYDLMLSDALRLQPLLMMRSAQGLAPQLDLNTNFLYRETAWLNLQYRHQVGMGFALGARFSERFMIGYNYEIPLSSLRLTLGGSHEVMLGMRFTQQRMQQTPTRRMNSRTVDEFKRENNAQYEKLDELQQRNEALSRQLLEYKKLVEDQNDEISRLKKSIQQVDDEMKAVIAKAQVDLQQESTFDKSYTYYLVIGAVRSFSEAKDFERIIRRETRIKPGIVQNENKTWFFIYSDELTSAREARDKIKDLESDNIANLIIGNPWVYKAIKSKN